MKKPSQEAKRSVAEAAASADEIEDQIRRRAYELWEQAGREHGQDTDHWLQAEQEVNQQPKTLRT